MYKEIDALSWGKLFFKLLDQFDHVYRAGGLLFFKKSSIHHKPLLLTMMRQIPLLFLIDLIQYFQMPSFNRQFLHLIFKQHQDSFKIVKRLYFLQGKSEYVMKCFHSFIKNSTLPQPMKLQSIEFMVAQKHSKIKRMIRNEKRRLNLLKNICN